MIKVAVFGIVASLIAMKIKTIRPEIAVVIAVISSILLAWNLMPMDASLNSSKSNRLPKWNPFFQNFAQNQYLMYQMIYDDMRIYLGRTRIISKR